MPHSFEDYRRIFEGAVAKYEGQDHFRKMIEQKGRPAFPSAPRNIAIIGIRHEGVEVQNRDNEADDIIALVRIDSDNLPMVKEYVGTTEPGKFDTVVNSQGDFRLNPGFYFFRLGIHHPNDPPPRGKNPCLVPDPGCSILGERARKGVAFDETDDKTWTDSGDTIHIHAGIDHVKSVGMWSAGCQVIAGTWGGDPWKEFFGYVKIATNFPVPYVLVMEKDLPALLA